MPRAVLRSTQIVLLLGMVMAFAGPAAAADPPALDAASAPRLRAIMALPTERSGANSGAVVAAGTTLFVVTPYPQRVKAIALDRPGFPTRWSYTPPSTPEATALAANMVTTPAVADGRLLFVTGNGHAIALDAQSGTVLWDTIQADVSQGEMLAGPPLVVDGRVILGSQGDDFGVRGAMLALDAASGRRLWRYTNVGPDADVGIGGGFRSVALPNAEPDRGLVTWPAGAWQQGGGGLSAGVVYDTQHELLIHGTGHPAPWQPDVRQGDNLWTSGLFARDVATGQARWFDPLNPHDLYALGAGGSLLQAELDWHGTRRTLLLHASANGYVYVIDPADGRILDAHAFVPVTATTGIDPETGTPQRNPAMDVSTNSTTRGICPGWPGATGGGVPGAGSAAFLPRTGLLYIPASLLCMDFEPRQANYLPGTPYTGANLRTTGTPPRGALIAWDVAVARPAWRVEEAFPLRGGVLATEGGLVFYGTLDGWFKAADAGDGRVLWQFQTGAGIVSQPVAFTLPDGRAAVAVLSGAGGLANPDIDRRDATAAHGAANGLRDLQPPTDPIGRLYVFALP
ncbi:MAG: PQQ-binding-like beta-propeller repeat protein [Proteobacteria bacterium]|nr:PQQ-binding-like beta-propeller repeat protein [Pseudomonadota bacterium]